MGRTHPEKDIWIKVEVGENRTLMSFTLWIRHQILFGRSCQGRVMWYIWKMKYIQDFGWNS